MSERKENENNFKIKRNRHDANKESKQATTELKEKEPLETGF